MFHFIQGLGEEVFEIVKPIIINRSYWFHSENLLLSLLADERKHIRKHAVDRILSIRNDEMIRQQACKEQIELKKKKKCMFKKQRLFMKPVLNFQSQGYENVIDWQKHAILEPPFTKSLSDDEIKGYTFFL